MLRRLLDSPWTYFVLAGVLAIVAVASQFRIHLPTRPQGTIEELASLRERKPNVVFILVDTLRADRLSAYGYQRPTSPIMKALADQGVRFSRAEAQSSWTKTSMASLWTGLLPTRTGVLRFSHALPADATLPAEVFQAAGYATAGIYRNGWVGPGFGFQQGFATYLQPVPTPTPERFEKRTPGTNPLAGTDEDATRAAISFLDSYGHQPFFLYLHYMDAHQYSYDQAAAELGFGTSMSDAYDSAINWVDRNVGAVLAALEERDLFDNTIVVIASDHGEAFREHGTEGHARNLHREVTDVPLIIGLPFRLAEGVVVDQTVSNLDIWPTILDLAGLPPLPVTDGRSLVPAIEAAARKTGNGDAPPAYAYLDRNWGFDHLPSNPTVSARDGDRRMILSAAENGEQQIQLYDTAQDPTEQKDLSASDGAAREALLPGLEQTLRLEPLWQAPEVEIDELSRGVLRALGYVVE